MLLLPMGMRMLLRMRILMRIVVLLLLLLLFDLLLYCRCCPPRCQRCPLYPLSRCCCAACPIERSPPLPLLLLPPLPLPLLLPPASLLVRRRNVLLPRSEPFPQ